MFWVTHCLVLVFLCHCKSLSGSGRPAWLTGLCLVQDLLLGFSPRVGLVWCQSQGCVGLEPCSDLTQKLWGRLTGKILFLSGYWQETLVPCYLCLSAGQLASWGLMPFTVSEQEKWC
jgi:hypothetical protein